MALTLTDRLAAEAQATLEPLNVDQYYQLMEAGVIREGAPIELIDGLLVRKDRRDGQGDIMTIGSRHASTIRRLTRIFGEIDSTLGIVVQSQQPVHINSRNEPEPDLSILRGSLDDFDDRHPGPNETLLIIEVADSSLGFDLGRKLELYRDAGIPEYWVVNLIDNVIEVFRAPAGETWGAHQRYEPGRTIELDLCGHKVAVAVESVLHRPS